MTKPADDTHPDSSTVREWQAQGLSLSEIGHRLGVSADRLKEGLGIAASEPDALDDHRPNTAEIR